ncbi:MAG: hypothetical protein V1835_03985 [Candidatus Micrarchaeota archaeon]
MTMDGSELYLFVNITNLAISLFLLSYALKAHKFLGEKRIEKALVLLIIAFGLSALGFLVKIGQEFGYFFIVGPLGRGFLDDFMLILSNLLIIFALIQTRKIFVALEVNKKANKLLREIMDDPGLSEMGNTKSAYLKKD